MLEVFGVGGVNPEEGIRILVHVGPKGVGIDQSEDCSVDSDAEGKRRENRRDSTVCLCKLRAA